MFINRLYCCFLAGVEYRTKDNNQVIKRSKILFNKVYVRVSWIRPTTRVGENRVFASAPKFSGIIIDFIKKVMLIFGLKIQSKCWMDWLQTFVIPHQL